MPQAVQRVFVTMTVTNDASKQQDLIKLINQSDNPATITHRKQPIISPCTTPPRQQPINRLGSRRTQYHIALAGLTFDFKAIIAAPQIILRSEEHTSELQS